MSLIKKPFELTINPYIKALLYGQPGIGKTTLAISSPSPLLLDFDGGIHRIKAEHQCDTVQVGSWAEVESVLKEDLTQYNTLVIDTAGKMLDYLSLAIIAENSKLGKADGALSLQGYGVRKSKFNTFLKKVSLMKKHLVFVAHEREEKDGDVRFIRPEIGGSSGNDLIKELDLVGYMEAVSKERTISFDPTEKYYGKNTCSLPSKIKLLNLDEGKRNDTLTGIFATYIQSLGLRKQTAEEYKDLMELVQTNASDITDADTANKFVEWMKGIQQIWDSALQAKALLALKSKELQLTWKKDHYENAKQPATV